MNLGADAPVSVGIDEAELAATVSEVLNHWPVAGLAVGVIRGGSLAWFYAHGVASIEAGTPVGPDTVFRIASVTKTMTAIAVLQLWEQGLVDLDAPASEYLRAYSLVPARASFRPATLRNLSILRLGDDATSAPVPQRPWTWHDLCGWYSFGPGVLTDPQPRMLGPSAEVAVRHGQLVLRGQLPVPAVRRGLAPHPDGADPDTFRISLPGLGSATSPAVFSRGPGGTVTALHLAAQPLSLNKRPDAHTPRLWATAAVAGGAVALATRHRRRACRAR